MSIEAKHAYRFGYLKSEQWKNVRLEALVREKGMCEICGEQSVLNDAHHVWYPVNIYDTKENQLAVLCRPCHEFLHTMLPECKTKDEADGRAQWVIFRNAVKHWRLSKTMLFERPAEGFTGLRQLGQAYDDLKKKAEGYERLLGGKPLPEPVIESVEDQINAVVKKVRKWGFAYAQSVKSENESFATPDTRE